jgi:hypothetical protein
LAQAITSDLTQYYGSGFVVLGLTGATLLMAMTVGERGTVFAIQWKGGEGGIVDG